MDIEQAVLDKIKPTAGESAEIASIADEVMAAARERLAELDLDVEVRMVGSFAKDTHLSDPDLDIFMLFPEGTPRSTLESVGLSVGEAVLGGQRMYAEHPYIRGVHRGLDVDLVPGVRIETAARMQTAVDRTPLHTEYVLSHMDEGQHDQVRLLKAFMEGIGTYGAEPNTRGFSGYLCELLVLRYGSFRETLAAAGGWKEGTAIALGRRGPPMIAPLTVYDPVDERRNVASAVHIDTMSLFIVAAAAYLESPSERFFFPAGREPLTRERLHALTQEHDSRLITVVFERPDAIEDNLYSQLWKTQRALAKKLDDFGYNVLRTIHSMEEEHLVIAFELERDALTRTHKHIGPPVHVRAAASFLSKWKGNPLGDPFIDAGRWNVVAERVYSAADEMMEAEAAIAGIGRELDPATMEVRDHEDSLDLTDPLLLTELLDPRMSWEI